MKQFGNEEILGKKSSKPREPIEPIKLWLLDQVRHSSEAADAEDVECLVVPSYTTAKVYLFIESKTAVRFQKVSIIVYYCYITFKRYFQVG